MTDVTTTVKRYLQTFNEDDATRRRALLDEVYTDDCRYTDPLASVQGRDAINGFLGAVRQQFPGVVFVLAGAVDAHHDIARFTWQARTESGLEPLAVGFDVVELAGGKIRHVHGFLDRAPGAHLTDVTQ